MTTHEPRPSAGPGRARPGRVAAIRDGLAIVGCAVVVLIALAGTGTDASSYWSFDPASPYAAATESLVGRDAFRYAPPIALALLPTHLLPFEAFRIAWLALELVCLVALLGPRWGLALVAVYPVALELSSGNIHLPLALAVAAGFRRPWTWSLVLLTKVTPGIGLLWFVVRREWRSLAVALGATLAIAVASFTFAPGLWADWLAMLRSDAGLTVPTGTPHLPIPFALRLPVALLLVGWGARTDRPWTVGVAATLALPTLWIQGLALLVAAVAPAARGPLARALATRA